MKTPSLLLACTLLVSPRLAQTSTWDGGGGDTNWTTAANWAGDAAPALNDLLLFDGSTKLTNSNNFAAGSQFNGITFSAGAGAFSLGGSGIDLGGNVTNLSANLQTIANDLNLLQNTTVDASGGDVTFSGVVSGSFGLIKNGGNVLRLSGTNTFTGGLTNTAGLLFIEESGSVDPGVSVTLGGFDTTDTEARLRVDGVGGDTKTVNGVTLTSGLTRLQAQRSSGAGTFTLEVGDITHQTGAVMDFVTSNADIHTTSTNTNGILGGWATTSNGRDFATVDGSGNLATYTGYTDLSGAGTSQTITSDATTNVRITDNSAALTVDTVVASTTVTVADTSTLAAGDVIVRTTGIPNGTTIVSIDSATTFTISAAATADGTGVTGEVYDPVITMAASGTTDVNTIIRQYGYSSDGVDTPRSINIGTGNTLRLGEYGAILRAEVNESSGFRYPKDSLTLNGGVLTAGGADNTDGEIVFSTNGRHNTSAGPESRNNVGIDVNSEIQDNGTGVVSVVIDSDQSTRFSGAASASTYSGGTYINDGRLISTVTGNIGTGDVTIHSGGENGGQLHLMSGGTYDNSLFIAGNGYNGGASGALFLSDDTNHSGDITLLADAGIEVEGISTLSGMIDGAGHQVAFYGSSSGGTDSDITITNAASDFSGGVRLQNQAGQYTSSSPLNFHIGVDGLVFGDTVMVDGASSRKGQSSTFLQLEGHDLTIGGLTDSGSGRKYIRNSSSPATTATLTVGQGNTGFSSIGSGDQFILEDGDAGAVLNVVKTGSGTQELGGDFLRYSGTTTVNEGTLLISGTLTGTSGVTANSGGTFEYTNAAALDRNVTVNTGGTFNYNGGSAYTGTLVLAGGSVGGSGNLGATVLSGTGTVDPGNSPGILAADSFDPTSGLGANFEFTLVNTDPVWSDAAASGNDVLRLTSAGTPFTAALGGSNEVGIYFNLASVSNGDAFTGGFYTDTDADFLASVSGADFQYYVLGDGLGSHGYNGTNYYTLAEYDGGLSFNVSTIQIGSADFADGTITDGWVTNFNVVPEPSTGLLLLVGTGLLYLRRRRG